MESPPPAVRLLCFITNTKRNTAGLSASLPATSAAVSIYVFVFFVVLLFEL